MNKNTIWTIIISLTLILGLAGGIYLVQTGKDTRSSASFATGTIGLYPDNYSQIKVGQEFGVTVKLETGTAKASGLQTVICFGPEVEYIRIQPNKLDTKILDEAVTVNGRTCRRLAYVSTSTDEATLPSGAFDVLTMTVKAKNEGSGNLQLLLDQTKVVGSSSSTDKTIAVTTLNQIITTYTIVAAAACPTVGLCPTECGQMATVVADGNCGNKNCPATAACPTNTKLLNFKMSFQGVTESSKCANNWPVSVVVLSAGTTHVYNNVTLTKTTEVNSKNEIIFTGGIPLIGINLPANDVAVFIKGPEHLQMKYGMDGQTVFYNKSEGELVVSNNPNDGKVYNFSNYSLMAGDVTGGAGDIQDGLVDGRDFNFVKEKSVKRPTVAEGGYLLGDLDGSCQINALDVTRLMLSLSEKQAQLY